MRFQRKAAGEPQCLAILAAAFHPVTRAHLALVDAALASRVAEEVLLVLPERFPHKEYGAVGVAQRVEMLEAVAASRPAVSVAISEGGLFLEIARECRQCYPPSTRLRFLCGRDAAERIAGWEYGDHAPPIERQLEEYELLVAPRRGVYIPPAHLAAKIHTLRIGEEYDEFSSTEVRERIAGGRAWESLVPAELVARIRELYS